MRPFSSSFSHSKKTGKANRAQAKTDSSPPIETAARATAVDEAFDFSNLESKILKSIEGLTHDLSQLRSGGRFNPEKIEELRVTFNDSTGKKVSTKVGDLAQVSARGRNVSVQVHEVDVCVFSPFLP
jgi:ribosome recycling factor